MSELKRIDWDKPIENAERSASYVVALVPDLAGVRVDGLGVRWGIKGTYLDGTVVFFWVDENGRSCRSSIIRNVPPEPRKLYVRIWSGFQGAMKTGHEFLSMEAAMRYADDGSILGVAVIDESQLIRRPQ